MLPRVPTERKRQTKLCIVSLGVFIELDFFIIIEKRKQFQGQILVVLAVFFRQIRYSDQRIRLLNFWILPISSFMKPKDIIWIALMISLLQISIWHNKSLSLINNKLKQVSHLDPHLSFPSTLRHPITLRSSCLNSLTILLLQPRPLTLSCKLSKNLNLLGTLISFQKQHSFVKAFLFLDSLKTSF